MGRLGVIGRALLLLHPFNNFNKYNHIHFYYCTTYNVQPCCVKTEWSFTINESGGIDLRKQQRRGSQGCS